MTNSEKGSAEVPKAARWALCGGGVLSLAGAGIVGTDLLRGLRDGVFMLTRHPVTAESGTRFKLTAFGEGFAVLALFALGVVLVTAAFRIGRNVSGDSGRR
jgi:hypothetical protein